MTRGAAREKFSFSVTEFLALGQEGGGRDGGGGGGVEIKEQLKKKRRKEQRVVRGAVKRDS